MRYLLYLTIAMLLGLSAVSPLSSGLQLLRYLTIALLCLAAYMDYRQRKSSRAARQSDATRPGLPGNVDRDPVPLGPAGQSPFLKRGRNR